MLSGFQRYLCMQYTTRYKMLLQEQRCVIRISKILLYAIHNMNDEDYQAQVLCYQDFKDTFVCNTQHYQNVMNIRVSCVIRISKILLYAIHNRYFALHYATSVVLSGFQRYFCMQYTTVLHKVVYWQRLCYQDFNERFDCKGTKKIGNMQIYTNIFRATASKFC